MKYGIESTLERTKEELKLAGYSPSTVSTYHSAAGRFLRRADKPSNRLTHKDVRDYMLYLTEAKYSSSTINQHHFSLSNRSRYIAHDRGRSQASRRQDRILGNLALLGTAPRSSPAPAHDRAKRWSLVR